MTNYTRFVRDKSEKTFLIKPIVCIINGCGASGKDTFVEKVVDCSYDKLIPEAARVALATGKPMVSFVVHNISSIDPPRVGVNHMLKCSGDDEEITAKTDTYRAFLSGVKALWDDFYDGSTKAVYADITKWAGSVIDSIVSSIKLIGDVQSLQNEIVGVVIFVHIREPERITHLIKSLETNTDIEVKSLLIDGRVDPMSYTNDSDRGVRNYPYDDTIENTGDMDALTVLAHGYLGGLATDLRKYYKNSGLLDVSVSIDG